MLEINLTTEPPHGTVVDPDFLLTEIIGLKRLLVEAESNAKTRSEQAEIEARERETASRLQKLILEELHHRIKNTLATVTAIVSQSLRNVPATKDAQHAISGRLLALGRAHDLLLQAKLSSGDLRTVIRTSVQAFDTPDDSRFAITGPDVLVTPDAVIAIAMTLNELCTNALKFGALSVPEGRVDLLWTVDQRRVRFAWTERHGPVVQQPASRSFGTRLIETLGVQLGGEVQLNYAPSGLSYTFDAPIAVLDSPVRPPMHATERDLRCR
ncbi:MULTISPECIES: sensor histidine kinase [unclassified Bradyrhizobium]|uniref:sensor histidine kinase n=1 Tax=unclassified Bradyrhizobium TaxID=2631580 RepID=UPI0028E47D87|nr:MULTISPECIES: sensor histidine kinase [unclassified Bradyrhizobium]